MELLARNATVNRCPIVWQVGFMDRIPNNRMGSIMAGWRGDGYADVMRARQDIRFSHNLALRATTASGIPIVSLAHD
ncbi:hypothetical protein [Pseudomonas floridensis]|uniref:hypothetical protein n=1 Tax=Pseudomonas floridensis TaxID=1958950 RepID=UPI0039E8874B